MFGDYEAHWKKKKNKKKKEKKKKKMSCAMVRYIDPPFQFQIDRLDWRGGGKKKED